MTDVRAQSDDAGLLPEREGAGRLLVLANPVCLARHGVTAPQLQAAFEAAGLGAAIEILPEGLEPQSLEARLRAERPAMVVAAGGDGTVHQVVNATAALGLPFGVLPFGTANDFARAVGLPLDWPTAVKRLAAGRRRTIDLGRVNGEWFVNACHAGLGVEAARATDARLKRWLGAGAYLVAALQAWRRARPVMVECRAENVTLRTTSLQLLVANGRYFGGGVPVGPEARVDEGLLDVYVLPAPVTVLEALRLAWRFRHGELAQHAGALALRTRRFVARFPGPIALNLDGEVHPMDATLEFEVVPGALTVVGVA